MISKVKLKEQVDLFKQKLAPNQNQQDALELAAKETMQKLINEAETKFQPIERVFLVAMCGEITTKQKQAEFVSRLILLDLLLQH
jgi:hypothetical protein